MLKNKNGLGSGLSTSIRLWVHVARLRFSVVAAD